MAVMREPLGWDLNSGGNVIKIREQLEGGLGILMGVLAEDKSFMGGAEVGNVMLPKVVTKLEELVTTMVGGRPAPAFRDGLSQELCILNTWVRGGRGRSSMLGHP
jgi:hypothetical protein